MGVRRGGGRRGWEEGEGRKNEKEGGWEKEERRRSAKGGGEQ